ncbi:MAG: type II toxin-antitoxin system RelE/ParE family toxin [Lachnospiraceae bacterium]|nr:type II toxin-antitoxin system RelE/ParE family toxin [Lachnospiraceae bacterium]
MRIIYENTKTEKQCTSIKEATKLFGGDKKLASSLLARINAIEQADVVKDIIVMPTFRFHNLKGKLDGYFAVDVKTIRDKWRIILQPLDEEENVFDPCNIDKIAAIVKIVEIREVSAHYE